MSATIPPAHKLAIMSVANHANNEGGNAFPSYATLGDECGCSERSARRQVSHLIEAGWLEITERGCSGSGHGGVRRSNKYQLHIGRAFTVYREVMSPIEELNVTEEPTPATTEDIPEFDDVGFEPDNEEAEEAEEADPGILAAIKDIDDDEEEWSPAFD